MWTAIDHFAQKLSEKKERERKGRKGKEKRMNTRWIPGPEFHHPWFHRSQSRAMRLITGIHRVGPGRQNFRAINYSKVCWPILGIAVQIFASIWECICVDGIRLSGWYSMKITFSSLDLLLIGSIDGTVELVLL